MPTLHPDFGTIDPIDVNEGDEGAIGDPVVATDADDVHLLYSIVADVDTTGDGTVNDTTDDQRFKIDRRTGQLSLVKKLDFELTDDTEADDAVATDAGDADTGDEVYTFMIKAEDPSGAPGIGTVTVNLKDVNEAPVFEAPGKDQKTLYIAENASNLTIYTNTDLNGTQSSYTADDLDAADGDSEIRFSLEGDDDNFAIDTTAGGNSGAPLTASATFSADYEDTPEYKVTIVATSGGTAADRGDREMVSRLDVTIKVVDSNDVGKVTFSSREPQVGREVLATLDEEDADIDTVTWKWFRGPGPVLDTTSTALTSGNDPCSDTNAAESRTGGQTPNTCEIPDVTSALYTPVAADSTHKLHAVATYNDKFNTGANTTGADNTATTRANATGSSEKAAQVSNPANTAPKFPDQDLTRPATSRTWRCVR